MPQHLVHVGVTDPPTWNQKGETDRQTGKVRRKKEAPATNKGGADNKDRWGGKANKETREFWLISALEDWFPGKVTKPRRRSDEEGFSKSISFGFLLPSALKILFYFYGKKQVRPYERKRGDVESFCEGEEGKEIVTPLEKGSLRFQTGRCYFGVKESGSSHLKER